MRNDRSLDSTPLGRRASNAPFTAPQAVCPKTSTTLEPETEQANSDVVLGNLTGLLARIKPAIPATKFDGEKSSKNAPYVDAVARTNVMLGLGRFVVGVQCQGTSRGREPSKSPGAMYDLSNGMVVFVG